MDEAKLIESAGQKDHGQSEKYTSRFLPEKCARAQAGYEPNVTGVRPQGEGAAPSFLCWMMARRRRQAAADGGDAAAEAAALADGEGRDEGEGQLALEDGGQGEFQGPVGRPTSPGPPTTPLFSPEQLRDLHEVQSQAPHLYAKMPRESVWRAGGGAQDQVQPPQQSTTTGTPSPLPGQGHDLREPQRGRSPSQQVPEVEEPEESEEDRAHLPDQFAVQAQGHGPGYQERHVIKGYGKGGPPGYVIPHNEGRGNPLLAGRPHLQGQGLGIGGWQHGHHYGSGPPNTQEMMTMLAMLRQENQQLRVEQAEMMDAMKFQRASLEAKVYDLQQELEQQMFRTPESGDTVKRHLEMTAGEQEKEIDLEKERKRLYELTPMQQFEQLQSLMGTPAPGNRGSRGRGQRERSRSVQGPRASGPGEEQTKGSVAARTKAYEEELRQVNGKGVGQSRRRSTTTQPIQPEASGSQDGVKGEKVMEVMAKLVNHLVEKESQDGAPEPVKPTDSAPIDLADWLTLIEPAMTDLSDSSGQWWELVVDEARKWYSHYIHLRPLQRATCVIEPSLELQKPKWVRVEKHAISMMLAAVPTSVKEELVATRALSPLGLVSKLMVANNQVGRMNAPSF